MFHEKLTDDFWVSFEEYPSYSFKDFIDTLKIVWVYIKYASIVLGVLWCVVEFFG